MLLMIQIIADLSIFYVQSDTDKSSIRRKLRSCDNANFQWSSSKKQTSASHALRRSMSQKDLLWSLDNYSVGGPILNHVVHFSFLE